MTSKKSKTNSIYLRLWHCPTKLEAFFDNPSPIIQHSLSQPLIVIDTDYADFIKNLHPLIIRIFIFQNIYRLSQKRNQHIGSYAKPITPQILFAIQYWSKVISLTTRLVIGYSTQPRSTNQWGYLLFHENKQRHTAVTTIENTILNTRRFLISVLEGYFSCSFILILNSFFVHHIFTTSGTITGTKAI